MTARLPVRHYKYAALLLCLTTIVTTLPANNGEAAAPRTATQAASRLSTGNTALDKALSKVPGLNLPGKNGPSNMLMDAGAATSAASHVPATMANPISVSRIQSAYRAADAVSGTLVVTFTVSNNLSPAITPTVPASTTDATGAPSITDTQALSSALDLSHDPHTIHNVLLTDATVAPAGYVDSAPEPDQQGNQSAWNLGDIEPLQSVTVAVTLSVPSAESTFTSLDTGAHAWGTLEGRAVDATTSPASLAPDSVGDGPTGDWLRSTVDANMTDQYMLDQAGILTQDPLREFSYVESLGYESYKGSLRGARGTLWSQAGNSLDKASLLIAMLRASSIPARYRHGTLSTPLAQQLILSMFPTPTQLVGHIPAGTPLADPANDPKLLSETRDHWWVEAYLPGKGWQDLDPSFAAATVGQRFVDATEIATDGTDRTAEVPDALRHKVTLSVKVETYAPTTFTDSNLSYSYPLTHTFDSVELVGEPVTLQHLVHKEVVTGTIVPVDLHEWTYTPYFMVGGKIFQGTPFDSLVSFFPFASHLPTAEWLEFDVRGADGNVQHYERVVKDVVGYGARQSGGTISSAYSGDTPFVTELDALTTVFSPGKVSGVALNKQAIMSNHASSLTARAAANYNSLNPGSPDGEIAYQSYSNLMAQYLRNEETTSAMAFYYSFDAGTDNESVKLLSRAYADSIRIVSVGSDVTGTNTISSSLMLSMDVIHNHVRPVVSPGQAAKSSIIVEFISGMLASLAENVSMPDTNQPSISVLDVFQTAQEDHIGLALIGPSNLADLSGLSLSHDAKSRIMTAINRGAIVIVPKNMVLIDNTMTVGWYEINPATGETIDTMENGRHADDVEYSLIVKIIAVAGIVSLNLMFGCIGAKLDVKTKTNAINTVVSGIANIFLVNGAEFLLPGLTKFASLEVEISGISILELGGGTVLTMVGILSFAAGQYLCANYLNSGGSHGDPPVPTYLFNPQIQQNYSSQYSNVISIHNTWHKTLNISSFNTSSLNISSAEEYGWIYSGKHAATFYTLDAPSADVYGDGNLIDLGATISSKYPSSAVMQGTIFGRVIGLGNQSFYSSPLSNLSSAGSWDSYTSIITSITPFTVDVKDVVLMSRSEVHTGNFTLSIPDHADLTGSGLTFVPNFASSAVITGHNDSIMFGPSTAADGGLPFDPTHGFALLGYSGPLTITHITTGTDQVQLGSTSDYFAVSASPASSTTDPTTPVTFQANINASYDDTYTTTVEAPDGWNVALDDTGQVTATPPLNAAPGDYTILVTAQSGSHPDLYASATHTVTITPHQGMAMALTPDPLTTVPWGPADPNALPGDVNNGQAQLTGAAYTVDITNTSTTTHTFNIAESGLPDGWAILSGAEGATSTSVTLPGGGFGQVGLYISPTLTMLPAAGTPYPFTVDVSSPDAPSLAHSASQTFTVPVLSFAQLTTDQSTVESSPGLTTTFNLGVRNVGNVRGTFPLSVTLPISDWAAPITTPLTLDPGQTITQTVIVSTPDGTLDQDYPVQIDAASNAYTLSTAVDVRLTDPAARAVDAAGQAAATLFPQDLSLSAGLTYLGQAIESLQVACTGAITLAAPGGGDCATDLRDRVVSGTQQVAAAAAAQSALLTAGVQIGQIGQGLGGDTTVSALQGDIDALQQDVVLLQSQMQELAGHGAQISFSPGRRVVLPGQPAHFNLQLTNQGSLTDTYSLTLTATSPSLTITPTALTQLVGAGATATIPVTATTTELGSADLQVAASSDASPDLAPVQARAGVSAVDALLRVTGVRAAPAFIQYGPGAAPAAVVATVANVADEPISGTARVRLLDAGGTEVYSTTQPLQITDALAPIDYPVGTITTTGLVTGTYTVAVDILDANGQVIPQASGQGTLGVGQAVQAGSSVLPSVVAPGDVTATTSITASLDVNTALGAIAPQGAPHAATRATLAQPRLAPSAGVAVPQAPFAGVAASQPQFAPSAGVAAPQNMATRLALAQPMVAASAPPTQVSVPLHTVAPPTVAPSMPHRPLVQASTPLPKFAPHASRPRASAGEQSRVRMTLRKGALGRERQRAVKDGLVARTTQPHRRAVRPRGPVPAARSASASPRQSYSVTTGVCQVPACTLLDTSLHTQRPSTVSWLPPLALALQAAQSSAAAPTVSGSQPVVPGSAAGAVTQAHQSAMAGAAIATSAHQMATAGVVASTSTPTFAGPSISYSPYTSVTQTTMPLSHLARTAPVLGLHALDVPASTSTDVCGTIGTDTHWTLDGSPYILNCYVQVSPGVTLTVDPGVVVEGAGNVGLYVQGTLDAQGTAAQPITFASAAITPAAGDWTGLFFDGASASGSQLSYVTVKDAGRNYSDGVHNNWGGWLCHDWANSVGGSGGINCLSQAVLLRTANPTFDHLTIQDSASDGLRAWNDVPAVALTNATFTDNGWAAIEAANPDTLDGFARNTFSGNGLDGTQLDGNAFTQPTHLATADEGRVQVAGTVTIAPSAAVTVTAGTTIQAQGNVGLYVQGTLDAQGTASAPVTFTSGSATPSAGDWSGVFFDGAAASGSQLSYVTVKDAGRNYNDGVHNNWGGWLCHDWANSVGGSGGINCLSQAVLLRAASPTFDHLTIQDSASDGLRALSDVPAVTLTNATVRGAAWAAIEAANPDTLDGFAHSAFSGNGLDGTQLDGGTFNYSIDIGSASVGKVQLAHAVTVAASAALTLEPGTTVVNDAGSGLDVQGTLDVAGTATQPISFTSAAASPAPGDWPGIAFQPGSLGYLDYTVLTYANTALAANQATVTIHDSVLTADTTGVANCSSCNPIDATYNYWGTADGPAPAGTGTTVSGPVDVTPFDTAPPTGFKPSYSLSPSLDQATQTMAVGGTATYHLNVRNTGNIPNTATLAVSGLDPTWYTLDTSSLALIPGQVGHATLTVDVPSGDCSIVGSHPFTVTATSQGDGSTGTVSGGLTLTSDPLISNLAPNDGTTIGSTDTLFSWQTAVSGTSTLNIWPSADPGSVQVYTATAGLQHQVQVTGLSRNTDYTWSVHAASPCGSADSPQRTLHVGNGVVFTQRSYDVTIERDYNQQAILQVTNQDDVSHTLLLTTTTPPANDLLVGFTGLGASDPGANNSANVLTLQPGETRDVTLGLSAQDAQSQDYDLVASLTADPGSSAPIQDSVPVHVHVHIPHIDFALQETLHDTTALTHTFRIVNNGDPLTDLAVTVASTGTGSLYFVPGITHGHLDPGQSVSFDAYTAVGADFQALTATVIASAAGVTRTLTVTDSLPSGKSMYLGDVPNPSMEVHNSDWYCTNRPIINDVLDLPSGFQRSEMTSGQLRLGLYPQSNVRPHNLNAYVNNNLVGGFQNQIPNGVQQYPVQPTDLNESAYGPSQNVVRLETTHLNGGHYVVASDLSLSVCLSHYREWVVAGSQQEANTIVSQRSFLIPPAKTLGVQILSPSNGTHVLAGQPVHVTARVTDDIGRAWSYIVVAQVAGENGTLILYDDGQHGDGDARDGVYGGTWIPASSGDKTLTVSTTTCTLSGSDAISVTVDDPTYTVNIDHSVPVSGVHVLTDTIAPAPQSIAAGDDATHLYWQQALDVYTPTLSDTFQSVLHNMQPGEVRQVAADTVITSTGPAGTAVQHLGPLAVTAAHLVALSPATQTVSSGGQATYTMTLSNPTAATMILTPTIEGLPADWVQQPVSVSLPASGQVNVPVTVRIPSDQSGSSPTGDYSFAASVQTDSGSRDQASASLTVADPFALTVAPLVAVAADGDVITYTATITNLTAGDQTYTLSTAGLAPHVATLPAPVSISAGQAVSVPVTITAGADLGPHVFTLAARDRAGTQRGVSAVLDVTADRRVAATLSPSRGVGGPGVPVLYHLDITNTGSLSDTYDLHVSVPKGWSATLEANGNPVSTLSLTPYVLNAADLWLLVTPSLDAAAGDDAIAVAVQSTNDTAVQASAPGTLTVTRYGVQVHVLPQHTTLSPLATGTWQAVITNTGSVPDTYDVAAGGVISQSAVIAPAQVSLNPGQSTTVQISAGDMAYALQEVYPLGITAISQANPAIRNADTADVTFTGSHGVDMSLQPSAQTLTDTLQTSYMMVITNTGNLDTVYRFTPSVAGGGLDLTPEVSDLEIPAHMTAGVLLQVTGHAAGAYPITVQADATDGSTSGSATTLLTIADGAVPTTSPTPPTPTESPVSPTTTASATSSPTASATVPASTPTATSTASTPTPTASQEASLNATATETPSDTPSATATDTPTATATDTPTGTPSDTPTATATSTPTATPRATATATATSTATAIPAAPTSTATATQAPTSSATATSTHQTVAADAAPAHTPTALTVLDTATATPLTAGVSVHPIVSVDRAQVHVGDRLCATGHGFLAHEAVTVAVDGIAVAQATASGDGSFNACFTVPGNIVAGRNDVSAVGAQSQRPAAATFVGLFARAQASTAYFVGASTAGGDEATLAILNPAPHAARVTLHVYRPSGAPFERVLTVGARTRVALRLSSYVPNVRGFGLRVQADQVVAAQMIVQRRHKNPYTTLGSGLLSAQWYLAEGYTNLSFHETLYILNPNSTAVRVQVRLLPFNGRNARVVRLVIAAQRTAVLDVNRAYPHASLAAIVSSDHPTAVTRVLTFSDAAYGATANTGTVLAATTWLFAEGSAAHGRQTFLTILNPGRRDARVTARFVDARGHMLGTRTIVVQGLHRGNIRLNDATGADAVASTLTSTQPVVVERPFYLGAPNAGRTGATLVYGRNGTGKSWTFPAGDTTHGAKEDLLALNPNATALALRVTFYVANGHTITRTVSVPAQARLTLHVNSVPGLANMAHGTDVVSTNGAGFIAEQSIYNSDGTTVYGTAGLAQ